MGRGDREAVGEVIEISAYGAPHPALRATFPKGEGYAVNNNLSSQNSKKGVAKSKQMCYHMGKYVSKEVAYADFRH